MIHGAVALFNAPGAIISWPIPLPSRQTPLLGAQPAAAETASRAAVIRLSVVVFLYWAGLYFYVPTLPNYVQSKTTSLVLVGTILSMYGLWQMLVRLPLGIAVDWVGRRKPFIIIGLVLVGAGAWMMGTADAAQGILIGRAITGLAAAAWVPLVVAFSRLFPPADAVRASAILTTIGAGGRIMATLSNGPLNNIGGYPLAFTVATGFAAVALLIAATTPEKPLPPRKPSVSGIGRLVTRRDVLLPSLLSAVAQYANWASTFGFLPILAKNLQASDVTVSTLVSLNIFLGLLGNLAATTLVRRMGARRLSYAAFASCPPVWRVRRWRRTSPCSSSHRSASAFRSASPIRY